jgi:hypothetical protein
MPDPKPADHAREGDRLIYGGLLGLAVAGSLQMIDKKTESSLPLEVAAYAFAASLPLLAVSLIAELVRHTSPRPTPLPAWRQFVGLLSALGAVTGLAALFFHLGTGPGVAFIVSVVLAAILVRGI